MLRFLNPHPRSAADQSMDTSEPKAGSSSSSAPTPAQPQAASGDPFKESDVANLVKMGFPREVSFLLHVICVNWTMPSTQEPLIEFSNFAFVSGGDSWAEKMQWWCQLGHSQPFCQKPFGRFQQEEIGNFLLTIVNWIANISFSNRFLEKSQVRWSVCWSSSWIAQQRPMYIIT